MRQAGMNMGRVKQQNRSAILNYICEVGPVSRKDIANDMGLTPAAVTQITTQLLEEGILVEQGTDQTHDGAGRRKVFLDIDDTYQYVYAVNIEAEITTVALCDLRGNLVEKQTMYTDHAKAPEQFLEDIANSLLEMGRRAPAKIERRIAAVTVGIPGLVDVETGVSIHAYGVWEDVVEVSDLLHKQLGLPVFIENNVDAFARAEVLYGIGRKHDNFLLIKWGPGVGSTIVIDKQIYIGRHGKTAELGHLIMEHHGELCNCGRRGCLETMVSYGALQKIQKFAPEKFGEVYTKSKGAEREKFDDVIDMFARAIVNATTILAPDRIVLSGNLFRSEEIRKQMIEDCFEYDPNLHAGRILYTELSSCEDYIGPVAAYVQQVLF